MEAKITFNIFEQWLLKFLEIFHKLTKRHKFHDVACQGNLNFCQGIVREMSGNFVSSGVWQPCLFSLKNSSLLMLL